MRSANPKPPRVVKAKRKRARVVKWTRKELSASLKHWRELLRNYRKQVKHGCNYTTDYLPLQLGWSAEMSVDWIEEEIRMLKRLTIPKKGVK